MCALDSGNSRHKGQLGFLLIHGLFGTPAEMRFVAEGLARAGHLVHCVKLAGHGGTPDELGSSTWQDWYLSAVDGLEQMRRNCHRVVVAGQSTGALLSLLLAVDRPTDVNALALYSPTFWLNGWQMPWYARLLKLIRLKAVGNLIALPAVYPHGIKDDRTREFVRKAFASGARSGGALLEHRWLVNAVKQVVHSVAQPTLIIHSRQDDCADLNNATYLQRALAGLVDMVVLDDSYHLVTVDRQRQVVVERTLDHANRILAERVRQPRFLPMSSKIGRRSRELVCNARKSAASRRVASG